ncbi:MAG: outer membrane protein assembly factor BamD, partial [Patescibacteria group bacterium]
MRKWKSICISAGILWAFFVFLPAILAVQDDEFKPNKLETADLSKRKEPGFFHRPAQASPASQLKYADKLLAEGKQKAAMKQFGALVHQWHASPEAAPAQLAFARILYDKSDYRKAFAEFQYLIENFAGQFPYEEALDKQFRIANYQMTAKRMKFFFLPGFSVQEEAIPLFEKIVKSAPSWKNSVEAQYNIGLINEQLGDYPAAIKAYDALRFNYPAGSRAGDAGFRKAYCLYVSANDSPRDETLCREALSALAGFIGDYPANGNIAQAGEYRDKLDERLAAMYYDRAVFYDKTPGKQKSALVAYEDFARKFPSSRQLEKAMDRIETLKKEIGKNK